MAFLELVKGSTPGARFELNGERAVIGRSADCEVPEVKVPPVEIELIDTRDQRPCGLGEVSSGPVMAAIGNAVAHALAARIRDLPMAREKIAAALLKG